MSWKAFGGEAEVQVVSLAGDDLQMGRPCPAFQRVKSVTIKKKTWGSLKGHVAPSEACSSQWLSHKPECLFLPLCRVTL